MKSLNNELIVHRGETFTIDKTLQNKDGSPYIISKGLIADGSSAYFLLTVASARYEQSGRYVKNYWLPVVNVFLFTQPVKLSDDYNSFDDVVFSETTDDYIGFENDGYTYYVYVFFSIRKPHSAYNVGAVVVKNRI